jgi:hypothetical protein
MSAIIEQFCIEYPLAQILTTSRIVGYEEARLDERQFKTLTIAGFSEQLVGQYVHKWFSHEPDTSVEDAERLAESLIQESSSISDIRSNPLMLSLICILYRGERSIPQSRSDVYEKCADLLFRRWDARRKIYVELRARHLIEPAIRYLAYWMLTRGQIQAAVSRRQLIAETTSYFQSRGFDENNDPTAAAEEFVDFCRGRAWVFSEVGSTAEGEQLYTFTHRTFLEYFAAYYVASTNEMPEQLARAIAPRVAKGEWDMVSQLAVQIKDRNVERGAERVFIALLGERRRRSPSNRLNVLEFLARCLASVQPRASIVKDLAEKILEFPSRLTAHHGSRQALFTLLDNSYGLSSIVAEALSAKISGLVGDSDRRKVEIGLELACCLPRGFPGRSSPIPDLWQRFATDNMSKYAEDIVALTQYENTMLWHAYENGLISADEVISICDKKLSRLFHVYWYRAFGFGMAPPIFSEMTDALREGSVAVPLLAALGDQLMSMTDVPSVESLDGELLIAWFYQRHFAEPIGPPSTLDHVAVRDDAYLGLLFCVALTVEGVAEAPSRLGLKTEQEVVMALINDRLASLDEFLPYVVMRLRLSSGQRLEALAVSGPFDAYFKQWAAGEISFTGSFTSDPGLLPDDSIA